MKKRIVVTLAVLSLLASTPAYAAAKVIPKDPRTNKTINKSIITFTDKLNTLNFDAYLMDYKPSTIRSKHKYLWESSRKAGMIVKPILSAEQVAKGLNNYSYAAYDFTEISMKSLPKIKYCLMSNKYDSSVPGQYRSDYWIAVKLYAIDCDSKREYVLSLPEFKVIPENTTSPQEPTPTETTTPTNK
jgi:hypothetical protein